MLKKIRAIKIAEKLEEMYPDADCTLVFREPFKLMISGILAAQCTDARVNIVADVLFRKHPTPKEIAKSEIEDLENIIRSCGFYHSKAKYIKGSMRILCYEYEEKVPSKREELIKFPGVGRKIANLILGDCFGIPSVVVDTHCSRISGHLGLSNSNDVLKIEQDLMRCLPKTKWISYGHLIVAHGRAVCNAKKPKCDICELRILCKKGTENLG